MSPVAPFSRFWRKWRRDGLRGVLLAAKWRFYRRKILAVYRRPLSQPVFEVERLLVPPDVEILRARPEHLEMMAANFPHKRAWYRERLANPDYYCSIAVRAGREVLAHNWFCTCPHRDPEMRCTIVPEPGEAYSFEGWCAAKWRGIGIAYLGLRHGLDLLRTAGGVSEVFTFIETDNRPTLRFHRRFDFADTGRKLHLRLGPLTINSKIKPLPPSAPT